MGGVEGHVVACDEGRGWIDHALYDSSPILRRTEIFPAGGRTGWGGAGFVYKHGEHFVSDGKSRNA